MEEEDVIRADDRPDPKTYAYIPVNVTNRSSDEEMAEVVERVWRDFWEPIIARAHVEGSEAADISKSELEQIKSELFDAHVVFSSLSLIYMEISDGLVSKPLTLPSAVLQLSHEREQVEAGEQVNEWLRYVLEDADAAAKPVIETLIADAKQNWPQRD